MAAEKMREVVWVKPERGAELEFVERTKGDGSRTLSSGGCRYRNSDSCIAVNLVQTFAFEHFIGGNKLRECGAKVRRSYNTAWFLIAMSSIRRQKIYGAGAAILLLATLTSNCGGGTANVPPPNVPWVGSVGSVLIGEANDSDHVPDHLWIGFNDSGRWQHFEDLRSKHGDSGAFWIGGHVVVSVESSVGFYFDPATTVAGEITAEGQQTTLDFIKADPATFANTGVGNAVVWYVPAVVEQISRR